MSKTKTQAQTPVFAPLLVLLSLTPIACADSIGFDDDAADENDANGDGDGDGDGEDASDDERIEHDALGGGVVRTVVDASDEAAWVYLDLDSMHGADEDEDGWEFGFQRFQIVLSADPSADEGSEVAVAILDEVEFEDLTAVPDDLTWITDAADGDDEDTDPDLAFGDWYDYDPATHLLSAKDRVYLVRTSEGAVFKLQLADYYSEAGTAGYVTFYWAGI